MNKYVLLQGIVMPLLTQISNTNTIYANTTGAVPGFNTIRSKVNEILVTGYGYTNLVATDVLPKTITANDWNNLVTDFQKIYVHLYNTTATFSALPGVGTVITEKFGNEFISKINGAYDARSNRPPSGQRGIIENTSTRTATWGSSAEHIIEHTVDYTWLTELDATHFFNLGGRISFALTSANGSGTTSTTWANWISNANSTLASTSYNYSNFPSTSTLYTNNSGTIVVSVTKPENGSNKLRANVKLNPGLDFNDINLDVTSVITCEYSSGALDAPRPQAADIRLLTTSTSVAPPIDYTPKLSVSSPDATPFTFSLRSGSTSSIETIFIDNIGNTATTVSSITFAENSYITPNAQYNSFWTQNGSTWSTTIPVGERRIFGLSYSGNTVGTYYSRFYVNIPAITNGSIGVDTAAIVNPKLFDFSITPSSVSYTTTLSSVSEQKFNITAVNGTYTAIPSASLSSNTGYTIIKNELSGPTVQFNGFTNTTFSTVLSVTATGTNSTNETTTVTKTIPITVVRNVPETKNLGTWRSALQPFNGVIGASYDLIDGERYVTLGFGMGADGSYSLANDPTGSSVDVRYLGINTYTEVVDSKYAVSNPPLYAGSFDSAYTSFLQPSTNVGGYGTWIRPSSYQNVEGGKIGPIGYYVERTYKFITATAGLHTWTLSSDNESYFTIDGALVGDLRSAGSGSYTNAFTGSVNLSAGEHTLTFYVVNTGYAAAIALRIVDPTNLEVWSTRFPIRIGSVYQNWQEVYRIPLTGNAQTYQCNDEYCIKNSNGVMGKRWGYYFGAPGSTANSMFTVSDDGSGNITIAMNSVDVNSTDMSTLNTVDSNAYTTISTAAHLFYYYSYIRVGTGYGLEQLSTTLAADGTTQYFLGFTKDGVVRTSSVIPPTDPTNTVVDQGGGGGGGSTGRYTYNAQ